MPSLSPSSNSSGLIPNNAFGNIDPLTASIEDLGDDQLHARARAGRIPDAAAYRRHSPQRRVAKANREDRNFGFVVKSRTTKSIQSRRRSPLASSQGTPVRWTLLPGAWLMISSRAPLDTRKTGRGLCGRLASQIRQALISCRRRFNDIRKHYSNLSPKVVGQRIWQVTNVEMTLFEGP